MGKEIGDYFVACGTEVVVVVEARAGEFAMEVVWWLNVGLKSGIAEEGNHYLFDFIVGTDPVDSGVERGDCFNE